MTSERTRGDGTDAMEEDLDEVQGLAGGEPGQDSPADDAVLAQEELYEGLSSARLPSEKLGKDGA